MNKIHNSNLTKTQCELEAIIDAEGLTWQELASISGCTIRQVAKYLAGELEMPEHRLRLIRLELGLARPHWTIAKRKARLYKTLIGADAV